MSTRRSVRELQRDLQYAQARENYTPPVRESGSATRRRPKVSATYSSLYSSNDFTIQVPQAGLQFFGGLTAVGLSQAVSVNSAPPRGFKPSTIHAMIADASPQTERARGSNRPYIRYTRGSRGGNTQNTFSCAFQDGGTSTPTIAGLRGKFETLATAKQDEVGGVYGRIWVEWEHLPLVVSGS